MTANAESADWYATVRVRINNGMAHNDPDAEAALRKAIEEEGGIWQVIIGWADPMDTVLLNVEKVKDPYG